MLFHAGRDGPRGFFTLSPFRIYIPGSKQQSLFIRLVIVQQKPAAGMPPASAVVLRRDLRLFLTEEDEIHKAEDELRRFLYPRLRLYAFVSFHIYGWQFNLFSHGYTTAGTVARRCRFYVCGHPYIYRRFTFHAVVIGAGAVARRSRLFLFQEAEQPVDLPVLYRELVHERGDGVVHLVDLPVHVPVHGAAVHDRGAG